MAEPAVHILVSFEMVLFKAIIGIIFKIGSISNPARAIARLALVCKTRRFIATRRAVFQTAAK